MYNENKKVISIRLVYVILVLFIIIIGIITFYSRYYNIIKTQRLAKSFVVSQEKEQIKLSSSRTKRSSTTSRSEGMERIKQEDNIQQNQEDENDKANVEKTETEDKNYISINEVKISKEMDLTVRTGLSREDFIILISKVRQDTSGFFEQNAGKIYDLCEEYSINEIFFCGVISAESGWNIAQNHRNTHNYISLMSKGKLINYSTVDEGLTVAAKKLHTNYLTPGGKFYHGKTLKAVKTNFCPASSTWVDLVYGRMQQIIK